MLEPDLSRLIGDIYESAAEQRFEETAMELLRRTGSANAMLTVADPAHEEHRLLQWYGALEPRKLDAFRAYEEEMYALDPTFAFVAGRPDGRIFDSSLYLSRDYYEDSAYIDWIRSRAGFSHWLVGYSMREDGLTFGVALHCADRDDPHPPGAREIFSLAFEHLDRAHRLATRPPALDCTEEAILILDGSERLVACSPAADRLLAAADGLTCRNRRLTTSSCTQRALWDRLVQSAVSAVSSGGLGGTIAIQRPSGRKSLIATIDPLPLQGGLGGLRLGAVVRLIDPEAEPRPPIARWRALWGLTAAEARVLEAFVAAQGDLRCLGDRLGISYNTVRTHMARIFEKTQTHSQPELMRLLAHVPSESPGRG